MAKRFITSYFSNSPKGVAQRWHSPNPGHPAEILSLDVEHTRTKPHLPIEATLVSNTRGVLLDTLIDPGVDIGDDSKSKGLPYGELWGQPTWEETVLPHLLVLLEGKHLIHWGTTEKKILEKYEKSHGITLHCAMTRFDPYYHQWAYEHGNYRYTKLQVAMRQLGMDYEVPGAHRAFPDACATLDVWFWVERNAVQYFTPAQKPSTGTRQPAKLHVVGTHASHQVADDMSIEF